MHRSCATPDFRNALHIMGYGSRPRGVAGLINQSISQFKVQTYNEHSRHDAMGEPDFSLTTRSGSISSQKTISALDVGVDDEDNHCTL